MHPVFTRVGKSVRSRLGLDALFAGAHQTKVPLEEGIEVVNGEGDVIMAKFVVTIDEALDPKPGDSVQFIDADLNPIPGEQYKLDAEIGRNGATRRFIAIKL